MQQVNPELNSSEPLKSQKPSRGTGPSCPKGRSLDAVPTKLPFTLSQPHPPAFGYNPHFCFIKIPLRARQRKQANMYMDKPGQGPHTMLWGDLLLWAIQTAIGGGADCIHFQANANGQSQEAGTWQSHEQEQE